MGVLCIKLVISLAFELYQIKGYPKHCLIVHLRSYANFYPPTQMLFTLFSQAFIFPIWVFSPAGAEGNAGNRGG